MATSSESTPDEIQEIPDPQEQYQDDYQYAWCQTGTFSIDFVKTDGGKATVAGNLSRAFIKDRDLLKASRRPRENEQVDEGAVEEIKTEMEDINLKTSGEIGAGDAEIEISQHTTSPIDEEKGDQAFEVLSKAPKHKRKREKKRKNYHYQGFEEYWDVCEYWLSNSTWRWDYGDHMTAENLEELEKQLGNMRPLYPIQQHEELRENPSYHHVTAKFVEENPGISFDEVYEKHCELVKKQAEADFHVHQAKSITRRCKDMMARVKRLGYTPGFEDSQFPMNYDLTKTDEKREKPVIEEIRYTIDDSYNRGFHETREDNKLDEDSTSDQPEPTTVTTDTPKTEPSEIRFNFDPETEQHLIASNAAELYANDPEIKKYYWQRYRLFSKLDEGILMDREGWFSVTPEAIAMHIADRVVRDDIHVVVDAFTGVGGNAIQFALKGAHVIAIDMDPVRLKCARQNAAVYNVEDYIHFICADYFHIAATWAADKKKAPKVDAVFLSPPWGGPSYLNSEEFDLATGCTPNGVDIFDATMKITHNIAYFLPRNTKFSQLADLSIKTKSRFEVEQSALNSKIKTITAYYGKLACSSKMRPRLD